MGPPGARPAGSCRRLRRWRNHKHDHTPSVRANERIGESTQHSAGGLTEQGSIYNMYVI